MISRISEAQRSKEKLMQATCFRCRDTKPITDLAHEEFMAMLASIGRPETQTFFVISCNLERRRRRDLMRSIAIIAFLALLIIGEAHGASLLFTLYCQKVYHIKTLTFLCGEYTQSKLCLNISYFFRNFHHSPPLSKVNMINLTKLKEEINGCHFFVKVGLF